MESQWRIARETFVAFDPDRALDEMMARIRSRRIAQVLRYWNGLRRGTRFPARAEIEPAQIKAALPYIMITGISYQPFRVRYRLVGTEIAHWSRVDFTNRYADELVFDEDGRDWTDYYRVVVDARRPAYGTSDWVNTNRAPQWVETLICPLSDDGETINRCLAVEDYEPISAAEMDTLPPVAERRTQPQQKASE